MAKAGIPKSVRVGGHQVPVSVSEKGKTNFEEADPRAPIKTSPFAELLPASEEWIKKYGGSDVSIVAYNVSVLLKEKKRVKSKTKQKGSAPEQETDPEKRR